MDIITHNIRIKMDAKSNFMCDFRLTYHSITYTLEKGHIYALLWAITTQLNTGEKPYIYVLLWA